MPRKPELDRALMEMNRRLKGYRLYRDYYDGDHRLAFATDKFLNAFGDLFTEFADNLCPNIVDTLVNRLQLEEFGFPEETDLGERDQETILDQIKEVWKINRMKRRAGELHLEAAKEGDAYVIIWPGSDGVPRIYPNRADRVTVRYSEEIPGELEWAAKRWTLDDGRTRVNLYYRDRTEKYVSSRTAWNAYLSARTEAGLSTDTDYLKGGFSSDKSVSYEIWTGDGDGGVVKNPWGKVPVFHLANNASVGEMGKSELKPAVPLQDALNKSIADMLVAMEFVALPQRWATGIEIQTDPKSGKPIAPWTPGVDRIWATRNKDATFGQFSQADLAQFLATQEGFRLEMARVTNTPTHYLTLNPGSFPSGEALKTAETPFISKGEDRTVTWGEFWEDVVGFCLTIMGRPGIAVEAKWKEIAPMSTTDLMNFLTAAQELKSRVMLRRAKFTDDEMDELGITEGGAMDAMLRASTNAPGSANGLAPLIGSTTGVIPVAPATAPSNGTGVPNVRS